MSCLEEAGIEFHREDAQELVESWLRIGGSSANAGVPQTHSGNVSALISEKEFEEIRSRPPR